MMLGAGRHLPHHSHNGGSENSPFLSENIFVLSFSFTDPDIEWIVLLALRHIQGSIVCSVQATSWNAIIARMFCFRSVGSVIALVLLHSKPGFLVDVVFAYALR